MNTHQSAPVVSANSTMSLADMMATLEKEREIPVALTRSDYSDAVNLLVKLADMGCGGSMVAAQVLLSTYNGDNWHMDLTDLCQLDGRYYRAAIIVIRCRVELSAEPHNSMDRSDLIPDIVAALCRDYGFTEKTPAGGGKTALRDGICPDCKKKSLWTWLDKPFHIQCNSVAKCGWESGIKNLYPDLFERFNKRYPSTPADPNATANAYLRYQRGFEPAELADWYSQANYWHPHGDNGTSTVRFPLAENVYWEKLIEPVTITDPKTGKTTKRTDTFGGLYGGLWWQPPGMTIEQNDTVYWAEGIFDAIALYLSGKKAVSIMSCGSFPEKSLADHRGKNILWMLALDNDAAGREYSKKHAASLRDMNERYDCVLPGESDLKTDWNDLWKQKRLDSDAWENYRYYGALLLAAMRLKYQCYIVVL